MSKRTRLCKVVYVDFDGSLVRTNYFYYFYYICMRVHKNNAGFKLLMILKLLMQIPIILYFEKASKKMSDRFFYKNYNGYTKQQVFKNMCEYFKNSKIVYFEIAKYLKLMRKRGYRIVIVSGSLLLILQAFKRVYPYIDDVIGVDLACEKLGVFNGKIKGTALVGDQKRKKIISFEHFKGYERVYRVCIGDSINDLPMLNYGNESIVINPGKALKKIASDNHWKIRYVV